MQKLIMFLGAVTPVTVDFSAITDTLTGALTPASVMTVLASCVGAGTGFFLLWFGVRKLVRIFTESMQSGKIRV